MTRFKVRGSKYSIPQAFGNKNFTCLEAKYTNSKYLTPQIRMVSHKMNRESTTFDRGNFNHVRDLYVN